MNSVQTTINFTNLQEIDILYRNKVRKSEMPKVISSADAYEYLLSVWSHKLERLEEFVVLCLNRANRVLGFSIVSSGGFSGTVADPKVIYQIALKSNSSSIILAHNHPSGETKPSENDIKLTKTLCKAGEFLELSVLDHLIITPESYYSFADEGFI